jgi:hypothetical protein
MALGSDGIGWLAEQPGVEAMAISDAQRVVSTPGFDRYREC